MTRQPTTMITGERETTAQGRGRRSSTRRAMGVAALLAGFVAIAYASFASWEREHAHKSDLRAVAAAAVAGSVSAERRIREGDILALLEIPTRGVEASVRAGVRTEQLDLAAGHVPGTALPGSTGNSVIAAHRDAHFAGLANIQLNDTIDLTTMDGTRRRYRVARVGVVESDDLSVLSPTPDNRLTLVTCYPFHWIGPAPKRFVVTALEIEGDA